MFPDFQARVRQATRTTVAVVCTYLIANALNFTLVVIEFFDVEFLYQIPYFYEISVEVSSLLLLLAGISRMPIYTLLNRELRFAVIQV